MGFLSKIKKQSPPIKMSEIEKLISENPHMDCISNKKSVIDDWDTKFTDIWLNPSLNSCVNCGHFTRDDFRDWAKGKGKIPKGDTQEEMDETVLYSKLYRKLPYEVFHSIDVDIDLDLDSHKNYRVETGSLFSKGESQKYPEDDIIMEVTCDYINRVKEEFIKIYDYSKYFVDAENPTSIDIVNSKEFIERYERYTTEILDELYGVLSVLSKLGHGYFGACNTPERLDNFGWSRDFILGRGYLEMLKEKGLKLPDAAVINKLRFK